MSWLSCFSLSVLLPAPLPHADLSFLRAPAPTPGSGWHPTLTLG